MKKTIHLIAIFPLITVSLAFLYANNPVPKTLEGDTLLKVAADFVASETDYLKARKKSNWKKIYNYQTAYYKKKVPFEEFVYYKGHKKPDWRRDLRESIRSSVSGVPMKFPSIEKMRAEIKKKKPQYKFGGRGGDFGGKISKLALEDQVQISLDGKYARVVLKVDIQWIHITTYMDILYLPDFWDLEDGKWRVQLNRWDYRPISGMRKPPGPDIQYKTISLSEIIEYRFKRAEKFFAKGKKKKARKEYLRAVAMRPLETYQRAPVDDPEVRNYLKETVLDKMDEWKKYLQHRKMVDGMVTSQSSWKPEKRKAYRAKLEKIENFFSQ